jgi:hypothetical protein
MEEDDDAYPDSESEEGTSSAGAIVQSMQMLLQHSDNTMTDAVTEIVRRGVLFALTGGALGSPSLRPERPFESGLLEAG